MSKQMLINYVPGEACRIAITAGQNHDDKKDCKLQEFYYEKATTESLVGNIYKGRVTNVESAIQAAFVEFGGGRAGFLHITDLHPRYFPKSERQEFEKVGLKTGRKDRPPIQQCLQRGQEILVQVIKEGINTKGPTVTSYLSIPGRFLVMMPFMEGLGASRKEEDDDERRSMKKILEELKPAKGCGFIVRTAGMNQTKTELKRELAYLQRLWKNIEERRKHLDRHSGGRRRGRKGRGKGGQGQGGGGGKGNIDLTGIGELYREQDLVIRTLRDVYSADIDRIVIDNAHAAKRAYDFLKVANPKSLPNVVCFDDAVPIFHRFGVEPQVESIFDREVPLPSGGSLVFDQTEALVAVDVNSGQSRKAKDAETNAFQTNCEAVDEIARQLRLRDLGGVVALDLIDMGMIRHRKQIEQRFRNLLKDDRARTRVGSISQFGILELTRQRMRPSLKKTLFNSCPHCSGSGYVKGVDAVVQDVFRRLASTMLHPQVVKAELMISGDVAFEVLNQRRADLVKIEQMYGKPILVRIGGGTVDFVAIVCYDERGSKLDPERLVLRKQDEKPLQQALVSLEDERFNDMLDGQEIEDEFLQALSEVEEELEDEEVSESEAQNDGADGVDENVDENAEEDEDGKKRRRRRRGGRRRKRRDDEEGDGGEAFDGDEDQADDAQETQSGYSSGDSAGDSSDDADEQSDAPDANSSRSNASNQDTSNKQRRGRRRGRRGQADDADGVGDASNGGGRDDQDRQQGHQQGHQHGHHQGRNKAGRRTRTAGGDTERFSGERSSTERSAPDRSSEDRAKATSSSASISSGYSNSTYTGSTSGAGSALAAVSKVAPKPHRRNNRSGKKKLSGRVKTTTTTTTTTAPAPGSTPIHDPGSGSGTTPGSDTALGSATSSVKTAVNEAAEITAVKAKTSDVIAVHKPVSVESTTVQTDAETKPVAKKKAATKKAARKKVAGKKAASKKAVRKKAAVKKAVDVDADLTPPSAAHAGADAPESIASEKPVKKKVTKKKVLRKKVKSASRSKEVAPASSGYSNRVVGDVSSAGASGSTGKETN